MRSFSVANSLIPTGVVKFRSPQNAFAMAIGGSRSGQYSLTICRVISRSSSTVTNSFPNFNSTRWQNNLRIRQESASASEEEGNEQVLVSAV